VSNTHSTPDQLAAIAAGDEAAFERLFRDWYPRLADHAWRLLGERDLAEDAVQEVFVALWRGRDRLPESAALPGYLHRAVRNRALNQLRSRKGEVADPDGQMVPTTEPDAPRRLEEEQLASQLTTALAALPPRTREVFLLSREHGLTYAAIGETLGISVKTVETLMGRAIRGLRDSLLG
jgi:RNA polymerase sigma-70 factor (ECF subfamily)